MSSIGVEKFPFMFPYKIPKGTYPGQEEDVLTVADGNFLAVNKDMDEELAYKLVKTIIENRKRSCNPFHRPSILSPKKQALLLYLSIRGPQNTLKSTA